mmetsp:Transcript_8570/g.19033  ORF Transcript_8570/g.19033 Transcript_8570/m.19033 type:complete len:786 (-) Transcript_8570:138-2495(-)
MGGCTSCARDVSEGPRDQQLVFNLSRLLRDLRAGGEQEILRLDGVKDVKGHWSRAGLMLLTELRLIWYLPSRGFRSISVGYGRIEEVEVTTLWDHVPALKITAQADRAKYYEFIFRTAASTSKELHDLHASIMGALQAYWWARSYNLCRLRQRELFVHNSNHPELAVLPLEEVEEVFPNILNFGARQEDLCGCLILTNCRVVWALDRDQSTYNVSVPHRAYNLSLFQSQQFGLCLVLFVPGLYMSEADNANSMRFGFGCTESSGSVRQARLSHIFARIKATQSQFMSSPRYGIADYLENKRRYQVDARVKLLQSLSRWDAVSEDNSDAQAPALEAQLQGEVLECVICLEQLCDHPPLAYLLAMGRIGRACRHVLHLRCAQQLTQKRCPVCRASFGEARELPDIRSSPGAWFDAMDIDRTGDLSREEVLGALTVVLPIDRDKLEASLRVSDSTDDTDTGESEACESTEGGSSASEGASSGSPETVEAPEAEAKDTANVETMEAALVKSPATTGSPAIETGPAAADASDGLVDLWSQWDKSGRGRITRAEFEDPQGGLLVWILARIKLLHRGAQPIPSLKSALDADALGQWFDFCDWGQVGFLTQAQIVRAVLREFEESIEVSRLGGLVEEVWQRVAGIRAVADGEAVPSCPSGTAPDEAGSGIEAGEASPDPLHLQAGICGRADFVDGLGKRLRCSLLEEARWAGTSAPANALALEMADFSMPELPAGTDMCRVPSGRGVSRRYLMPSSARERLHSTRAPPEHPGDSGADTESNDPERGQTFIWKC